MPLPILTVLPVVLTTAATAPIELHGLRVTGDLVWIDATTGAASFVASTGLSPRAAWDGQVAGDGGQSATPWDALIVAGETGELHAVALYGPAVLGPWALAGVPAGYRIVGTGSASNPQPLLLVSDAPGQPELLARLTNGEFLEIIGSTGRSDLVVAAEGAGGVIYALAAENGGALYMVNPASGAASLVGGQGTYGPDTRALTAAPDGTFLAAGAGLRSVDPLTGEATLIGPTGFGDIVGLVVGNECYPNCDGGGHPALNVADFSCFLQRFAAGHYYGNCDRSTTPPTLNVADFTCFLQRFYTGCP